MLMTVGPKDLGTPTYFISSPRPTPKKKKCSRTNKKSPDCQDILLRTTLSSTNRNLGRGRRHAAKDSLLEHPKRNPEHNRPTIGAR